MKWLDWFVLFLEGVNLFVILYSYFETEWKRVCEELDYYDWDINHLGHDFSDPKVNNIDMRKCQKCGVLVHHYCLNDRYNTHSNNYRDPYPTLILTCEEYIIKSIIE